MTGENVKPYENETLSGQRALTSHDMVETASSILPQQSGALRTAKGQINQPSVKVMKKTKTTATHWRFQIAVKSRLYNE